MLAASYSRARARFQDERPKKGGCVPKSTHRCHTRGSNLPLRLERKRDAAHRESVVATRVIGRPKRGERARSPLIGLGGGPLFVGVLSDLLKPGYGVATLQIGLLSLTPAILLGVAAGWMASRALGRAAAARSALAGTA